MNILTRILVFITKWAIVAYLIPGVLIRKWKYREKSTDESEFIIEGGRQSDVIKLKINCNGNNINRYSTASLDRMKNGASRDYVRELNQL